MSQNFTEREPQSFELHLVATASGGIGPMPDSAAHRAGTASHGIALTADILFASDSDELDLAARDNVDRLATFLEKNLARTASIEGYTDSAGQDLGNQDLSLRRAASVEYHLVARGIASSRLTSVGRGSSYPAASNASIVGRQQNRRVEVLISNNRGSVHQVAGGPSENAWGTLQSDTSG